MTDYIKKIHDLLALAESSNEHEARAALLKARQLMTKYKINEQDLENPDDQKVEQKLTDINYSIRRDPWINELAYTIAKHHCCKNFQNRAKGKQTAVIGFIGLTNDIAVCMEVFKYAVDCIRSKTNKYRKIHGVQKADGYGYGFVLGLIEAYEKQQKENKYELVLVVPEAVNNVANGIKTRNQTSDKLKSIDANTFYKGMKDGQKFNIEKRLQERTSKN